MVGTIGIPMVSGTMCRTLDERTMKWRQIEVTILHNPRAVNVGIKLDIFIDRKKGAQRRALRGEISFDLRSMDSWRWIIRGHLYRLRGDVNDLMLCLLGRQSGLDLTLSNIAPFEYSQEFWVLQRYRAHANMLSD